MCMVLETGANDGLRGIPPATLKLNLERALDRIKAKRPDARVVLVQMEALPNLGPKYARGVSCGLSGGGQGSGRRRCSRFC